MNKEYCCDLKELFGIFEEELSASDILSAKVLSEISSDIMKYRMELGMTQKEFAKFMDVSQGMVSKWEGEDYNFSIKTLANIAAKLNLELSVRMKSTVMIKSVESIQKFKRFTSTEKPLFVINNSNHCNPSNHHAIRYAGYIEPLKIRQEGTECCSM